MEIAWHEIPAMWEEEILKLSVSHPPPMAMNFALLHGRNLKHRTRSCLCRISARSSSRSTRR